MKNKKKIVPLAKPFFDYKKDIFQVSKCINSTFVGPGSHSEIFSKLLKKSTHSRYIVLVNSGTTALTVSAIALGLKRGDEIIIPAYGVFSVINAFECLGLKIKLCDINKNTGCLDFNNLKNIVTNKTKAICYVALLGNSGETLKKVNRFCIKNKIKLINDAAWSLGREINGNSPFKYGHVSITSFSVPKIITTGQGGAIFTESKKIFLRAKSYVDQGDINWRKKNNLNNFGENLRMSDLNASLGISQIRNLKKRITLKKRNFELLNKLIKKKLVETEDKIFPQQNVIFVKNKKKFISFMRSKGILISDQYRVYSHIKYYKKRFNLKFRGGVFWEKNAVYLPFGVGSSPSDIKYISKNTNLFLKKIKNENKIFTKKK